jgi:PKD repeat protein
MAPRSGWVLLLSLLLAGGALHALPPEAAAWGNGSPGSVEWPNFGVHDITTDIALRTATYLSPVEVSWLNDWYVRNETDWGLSFDPASTGPTDTDNVIAYTDDPDSHIRDWDNHTLYLHPRPWWDPPAGDAARRVQHLYNLTRDHVYGWLMNGSVRWDADQHLAAYYGGLMAHYVMDVTQFGHTDWTQLDHSHPADDPDDATYHGYYESRTWTDRALKHLHVDLMANPLPEPRRVSDAAQAVRDLAAFVNDRHGPTVQFPDVDSNTVTLGSTYVRMLTNFTANWDANLTYNDARGFDEDLWGLTLENLLAGMDNLTNLWASAYIDAHAMFMRDAADLVVTTVYLDPASGTYEGDEVTIVCGVWNNWTEFTGLFNLTVLVDDEVLSERRVAFMEQELEFFQDTWTAVAGTHDIRVIADPFDVLPERNETNNMLNTTYEVVKDVYGTTLTVHPVTHHIYQETTGSVNLTLGNTGNRPETYTFLIRSDPGEIDFSLTILEDSVSVPAFGNRRVSLNYTTRFDNPPGPREFQVVAMGGNSSASLNLTFVITKREVAPYVVVDYPFFTNVSVPIVFNASGTWDPNGDVVTFSWDFGDGRTGTGAVVDHTYVEEGVYLIQLVASDGKLERHHVLEVSVEDALQPTPRFTSVETDMAAIRLWWRPWDSKYFKAYHFYLSTNTWVGPWTPEELLQPEYLFRSIEGTWYVDNLTIEFDHQVPEVYLAMEIENVYGHRVSSGARFENLDVRVAEYTPMDWLSREWMSIEDVTKHGFHLRWREWRPLVPGGHYEVRVDKRFGAGPFEQANWTVHDLADNHFQVTGLDAGCGYEVRLYYLRVGTRATAPELVWTVHNVPPAVVALDDVAGFARAPVEFTIPFSDEDGWVVEVSVRWGDGTEDTHAVEGLFIVVNHTYAEAGTYNIWVTVEDDDRNWTSVGLFAEIEEAWPIGFSPSFWMVLGIFAVVALLGVLAVMVKVRRRRPRKRPGVEHRARGDDGKDGGGGSPPGDG